MLAWRTGSDGSIEFRLIAHASSVIPTTASEMINLITGEARPCEPPPPPPPEPEYQPFSTYFTKGETMLPCPPWWLDYKANVGEEMEF